MRIHRGEIRLIFNRTGETVTSQHYNGKGNRNNIVQTWKKCYGIGYAKCSLQIAPEIDTEEQFTPEEVTIWELKLPK